MNSSRIPPKRVKKKKKLNANTDAASMNPNATLVYDVFLNILPPPHMG